MEKRIAAKDNKPTCRSCAKYEYLHEYETHMCNAKDHPIREEMLDWEDECDFYEKYCELEEIPDVS